MGHFKTSFDVMQHCAFETERYNINRVMKVLST